MIHRIITAYVMLVSAIVMALISLFTPPEGEIADTVLWYIAQSLLYAASAFGLSAFVELKIKECLKERKE